MAKSERSGKVQTVLGLIDKESLGVTLTHEHLLFDGEGIFTKPKAASEKELVDLFYAIPQQFILSR